jgi:chromatin segregation and condensation protein Rec8/ScpA/Scc1 (kleisin family)
MKTANETAKVATLLGKTLPNPITVEYSYREFETPQEVKDAGEWPNDKDVLKMVNADAKIGAMAKAKNEHPAVKAFIESITGTVEYRREKWVADSLKQMPSADRAVLEAFAAQNIQ